MKLKQPVRVSDPDVPASFACLPDRLDAEFSEQECWLAGWGMTNCKQQGSKQSF